MIKQLIATPIPVLVQQQREFFRTEQTQEIAFRLGQLAKSVFEKF